MNETKYIDFAIGYEHWQRELYGDTLLKMELENRGYSVKIFNRMWNYEGDPFRKKYAPKIVIYPWIYTNLDVVRSTQFKVNPAHIVNLQSEQIFSNKGLKRNIKYAVDDAKKAYHICWGKQTFERFIDAGVDREHLRICGNINIDIDREEFNGVFANRMSIAQEYGIDMQKKWILYFSNFKKANSQYGNTRVTEDIIIESQREYEARKKTLEIIDEYLQKNDDSIIIYRPHPVEGCCTDKYIYDLQYKYPKSFYVIADETIQQWIKVCDYFLTYISTSLNDAYFWEKPVALVRPIPVPYDEDAETYHESKCVENYNDLINFLNGDTSFYALSSKVYEKFIDNRQSDYPAFFKLADWLEEIYQLPPEDFSKCNNIESVSIKHRIKRNLLLEKDGFVVRTISKLVLLPFYRMAEVKDMSKYDVLTKIPDTMPFSELKFLKEKEKEIELKIKEIMIQREDKS